MSEHFKKQGDEYLLSPAATLTLIADAIHSAGASPAGKARAKRVISDVMSAARGVRFEQVDILETMLASGSKTPRLMPLFDALVKRVGAGRVTQLVQQGLADARGDKA